LAGRASLSGRVTGLYVLLAAGNAAAWLWAVAAFCHAPVLLGTGAASTARNQFSSTHRTAAGASTVPVGNASATSRPAAVVSRPRHPAPLFGGEAQAVPFLAGEAGGVGSVEVREVIDDEIGGHSQNRK
jgi:hypothetical protein